MKAPVFQSDKCYLHRINSTKRNQVLNFLLGGYATPASLDVEVIPQNEADFQSILSIRFQKSLYTVSVEELRFGLQQVFSQPSSYRMRILGSAAQFRIGNKIGSANLFSQHSLIDEAGYISSELNVRWSDKEYRLEEHILNVSELEIAFELGRRTYAQDAPSRITCLYMVEDTIDNKSYLEERYYGVSPDDIYLKLGICFQDKISKVDVNWFDLYKEENRECYIENYWLGVESANPQWEVLFEGMVGIRSASQKAALESINSKYLEGIRKLI